MHGLCLGLGLSRPVPVTSGGGGAAPEPLITIDLVTNTASVDGAGAVAVDTLLGDDPNTETAWGFPADYDDSLLGEHGLAKPGDAFPALIGAARTMLLAGATIVIRTRGPAVSSGTLLLASEDGESLIYVSEGPGDDLSIASNGSLDVHVVDCVNSQSDSINCIAITITDARCEMAVNGSAADAQSLDATDIVPGSPLVACALDFGTTQHLQSIEIFEPLPTTEWLSELSEVP